MVTYNTIIEAFETFCTTHKQINKFYSGATWNFQSGTNNTYPAVIMLPQNSTIGKGFITLTFNMFVVDILNADRSNLDEIFSDTLQIAGDIVAYFRENEDTLGFSIQDIGVELNPLEETLDDVLAGFMATINIDFPFNGSICQIPKL